jgi:hypothetical protein
LIFLALPYSSFKTGRKSLYGPSDWPVVHLSGRELTAEIVESCRSGDRDAFRALYDLYKDRVYSIALYFFHGDPLPPAMSRNRSFSS